MQILELLPERGDVAREKLRLLLQVLAPPNLRGLFGMLGHFRQFVLELIPLNVQLHHVLLNVANLLGLIGSLGKVRVSSHATTSRPAPSIAIGVFVSVVGRVERPLEIVSHHL